MTIFQKKKKLKFGVMFGHDKNLKKITFGLKPNRIWIIYIYIALIFPHVRMGREARIRNKRWVGYPGFES